MSRTTSAWGQAGRAAALIVASLGIATLAIAGLERLLGLPDASAAYVVAVVFVAFVAGTIPALATACGAFLVYDYLFIDPLHTLAVDDPGEWLTLLLLLFVGLVVGRLTGLQRERAAAAEGREREARALFAISRTLALAPGAIEALPDVMAPIIAETHFERAAIALVGHAGGPERFAADTAVGSPPMDAVSVVEVLQRRPGAEPAEWRRVHYQGQSPPTRRGWRTDIGTHRIWIESGGTRLGSLWLERPRSAGDPTREETRIASAAADQVGRVVERDRLAAEALRAEVARRADAAKTALLDSVSHDLRTPLAAIRAAAGNLMDPAIAWSPDVVRQGAAVIDAEADRMSRLVADILDLSRIEAGAIVPEARPFVLADIVSRVAERIERDRGGGPIDVRIDERIPPVLVDEVLVEQVLVNVLENALDHAPGATVRIEGSLEADGAMVRLVIDDDGPGVPAEAMDRIFEKFYRVPRTGEGSRRGSGIGLAVVHGMVQAMGGEVHARPGGRGGLAIVIDLPTAPSAPEQAAPVPAESAR